MPRTNKDIYSKRTRGLLCVKPSSQTACPRLPAWLITLRFSPFMKESTWLVLLILARKKQKQKNNTLTSPP